MSFTIKNNNFFIGKLLTCVGIVARFGITCDDF